MVSPTIIIGILLIIVGLAGYLLGIPLEGQTSVSITALIPAFFGAVLLVIARVTCRGQGKVPMHAMHIGVLVGLLGFIASAMRIPKSLAKIQETGGDSLALYAQSGMAILCFVYVVLCIGSFVRARLLKKA